MWVNGLPPEAAVWRVDGQQWTTLHELLALNAEVNDRWGHINAQLKSSKKLKSEPLEITRPRDKEQRSKDRVITDAREIAAFFE